MKSLGIRISGMYFFGSNDLSFVWRKHNTRVKYICLMLWNIFQQMTYMSNELRERSAHKLQVYWKDLWYQKWKNNVGVIKGTIKGGHKGSDFPLDGLLICIAGKGEFVIGIGFSLRRLFYGFYGNSSHNSCMTRIST